MKALKKQFGLLNETLNGASKGKGNFVRIDNAKRSVWNSKRRFGL